MQRKRTARDLKNIRLQNFPQDKNCPRPVFGHHSPSSIVEFNTGVCRFHKFNSSHGISSTTSQYSDHPGHRARINRVLAEIPHPWTLLEAVGTRLRSSPEGSPIDGVFLRRDTTATAETELPDTVRV